MVCRVLLLLLLSQLGCRSGCFLLPTPAQAQKQRHPYYYKINLPMQSLLINAAHGGMLLAWSGGGVNSDVDVEVHLMPRRVHPGCSCFPTTSCPLAWPCCSYPTHLFPPTAEHTTPKYINTLLQSPPLRLAAVAGVDNNHPHPCYGLLSLPNHQPTPHHRHPKSRSPP